MITNNGQSATRMESNGSHRSPLAAVIRFCLEQKLVVALLILFFVGWGIAVAPFDWDIEWMPRRPVAVDAIPDIGENQQIVFTEWPGRSPQDVEDQITYPLTVSLLGVPGVKDIRSYSYFGYSSIYVVFKEDIDFYWSRSRILEKLNALPPGTLPDDARPALGPDATALGQVYWYTLEGRDPDGQPAGGWDLDELRSVQDWYVRYGLLSAEGVAEVASIGGFVREYQVDIDPDAMRAHGITLPMVFNAVRKSNVDVGARTIEINSVEYVIRGLGFIQNVEDLQKAVVKSTDNVPITLEQVASVHLGPAERRGALDKGGAEAVGGVVVTRFGENPLATINAVKDQIEEISPGLPEKVVIDWSIVSPEQVRAFVASKGIDPFLGEEPSLQLNQDAWLTWLHTNDRADWPAWINTSKVTIVPFYDRSGLIGETLGTLNDAIFQQVLITIIVVIVMVLHLRSSILISAMLPMTVLITFIAMKTFGVAANAVALAGIAIAIGTVVDVGIVLTENMLKHLDEADPDEPRLEVIYRAATEVAGAVLTAVMTTVVSFLPVFTMIGAEGKLFRPLAFTKTFALIASIIVALTLIPPVAHVLMRRGKRHGENTTQFLTMRNVMLVGLVLVGAAVWMFATWWVGVIMIALGTFHLIKPKTSELFQRIAIYTFNFIVALIVAWILTVEWMPLGPQRGMPRNIVFVLVVIGGLLLAFRLFHQFYAHILRWCLNHKPTFLAVPVLLLIAGLCIWLGFGRVFAFIPAGAEAIGVDKNRISESRIWRTADAEFPGLGKEFMPALDEGSFLFMPSTMPHASIGEAMDILQKLDAAISTIPEVEQVVGKIGRADSPLDPAPISMIETVVNYKSEFVTDEHGRRLRFKYDEPAERFIFDESEELIEDRNGRPFRQWRDHIRTPDDIWQEIEQAAQLPGATGAPQLQPIETRIVMLQTGMRAPIGIKVRGPNLETIEQVGVQIESLLKQGEVPGVDPLTVNADRIVGKPYLEIEIDRDAIQRYNLTIRDVQDVIEIAIGGRTLTRTVEGRERYPVRVRYMRELRDDIESLQQVIISSPDGTQVPLAELAVINYVRGPMVIKSEDTFLVGYITFGKEPGFAEVDVVEATAAYLQQKQEIGELAIPTGVTYRFSGTYENQIRATRTLMIVIPLALFIIFLILYLQFRSTATALIIFTGVAVAWAGGFVMLWLYAQPNFMDVSILGSNARDLFQVHPVNLSVAVWVGFLALFGIATDDGVVIATYLKQSFEQNSPTDSKGIRDTVIAAGLRRVRPCLMTTATTVLALLPVLTSTGRGSDIMAPMAIPIFGGMVFELLTMFVVPVLYCAVAEVRLLRDAD